MQKNKQLSKCYVSEQFSIVRKFIYYLDLEEKERNVFQKFGEELPGAIKESKDELSKIDPSQLSDEDDKELLDFLTSELDEQIVSYFKNQDELEGSDEDLNELMEFLDEELDLNALLEYPVSENNDNLEFAQLPVGNEKQPQNLLEMYSVVANNNNNSTTDDQVVKKQDELFLASSKYAK